jgi:hypothetical protein
MYKGNAGFYGVLFNTSFYNRKIRKIADKGLYKHFITCYYISNTKYRPVLYDAAKGTFSGTFVVPTNDICNAPKIRYDILTGYQGKAMTCCTCGGRFKATIYDLVEVNQTTSFEVFLTNGIKVPIISYPAILSQDVYYSLVSHNITAFRNETSYQKVTYRVKRISVLVNTSGPTDLLFNPRFCLFVLLGLPGPRGIELTEIYSPKDGLFGKGIGRTTFEETITSFHPFNNDVVLDHIQFNPDDGSLLHMIRSRNKTADMTEYITSVEIYKRVI